MENRFIKLFISYLIIIITNNNTISAGEFYQLMPDNKAILDRFARLVGRDTPQSWKRFNDEGDRDVIKSRIRRLLKKRQKKEYKRDSKFRKSFETEVEDKIHKLHRLITAEEIAAAGNLLDGIDKTELPEPNLFRLYQYLRQISGLDLLDEIENCAVGPTSAHIALSPVVLEKLAKGDLDFFRERFAEAGYAEADLLQINVFMEGLRGDREIFTAFALAFILHDYGLLLMKSGSNPHAVDGERLLGSLLGRLSLTDIQKKIIKILVGEHAKLYMLLKGGITPQEYRCSIGRLKNADISAEDAIKMSTLFLFLDIAAGEKEWITRYGFIPSYELIKEIMDAEMQEAVRYHRGEIESSRAVSSSV